MAGTLKPEPVEKILLYSYTYTRSIMAREYGGVIATDLDEDKRVQIEDKVTGESDLNISIIIHVNHLTHFSYTLHGIKFIDNSLLVTLYKSLYIYIYQLWYWEYAP